MAAPAKSSGKPSGAPANAKPPRDGGPNSGTSAGTRPGANAAPLSHKLFALAAGLWIGLSLLKFGNPAMFDSLVAAPTTTAEFLFTPWPIAWGYLILAVVAAAGLAVARPEFRREQWPLALFGAWLFWQFLSGARSIEPALTKITLIHFTSCAAALLLGWWGLARVKNPAWFWVPVLLCFFQVLFMGFDQHNGGLESTRREFYAQPNWQLAPKEFLLRMESGRIFSTLLYPNTLAGVILLLLPVSFWQIWSLTQRWPKIARGVALGLFAYLGFACLYWSGSKGGWLIALILGAVVLLHLSLPRKLKLAMVALGLSAGLALFFIRFSGYFQKGATSVGARFYYWNAALQTAKDNPILGTGPGTFAAAYRKIKPPEAEMAKLAHNDYLQQASDTGMFGFLTFSGFIFGSMGLLYRKSRFLMSNQFFIWLGLLGWCLQGFIEFGLYIPATAWPALLFFGWLWGIPGEFRALSDGDKSKS